jgi:hypothetical protein
MKIIIDQQLTKYAIPDGEGLTALPISFKYVIASARCEAISELARGLPHQAKAFLATT